jgi:hypothetical protein
MKRLQRHIYIYFGIFSLVFSLASLSAATAADDSKEAVLKALRAMNGQAFRMKVFVDMPPRGMVEVSTVEFAPPNRSHSFSGEGKARKEVITVVGKTYLKGPDGKWSESGSTAEPQDDSEMVRQLMRNIESGHSATTLIGPDAVSGVAATLYQVNDVFKQDNVELKGTTRLWVRTSDGLPIKQESEVGVPNRKFTIKSMQTYEYDSSIKIEPPIH